MLGSSYACAAAKQPRHRRLGCAPSPMRATTFLAIVSLITPYLANAAATPAQQDPLDPYFTQDPGFNAPAASGLPPGSVLSYSILSSLTYWSGIGA